MKTKKYQFKLRFAVGEKVLVDYCNKFTSAVVQKITVTIDPKGVRPSYHIAVKVNWSDTPLYSQVRVEERLFKYNKNLEGQSLPPKKIVIHHK